MIEELHMKQLRNPPEKNNSIRRHHDLNLRQVKMQAGERVWLLDYFVKKGTSKKFHQPWKGPYDGC